MNSETPNELTMKVEVIIKVIITPESKLDCESIKCKNCRFAPLMNPRARECYNMERRKTWRYLGETTNNFLTKA
jgi:hypothetical protein